MLKSLYKRRPCVCLLKYTSVFPTYNRETNGITVLIKSRRKVDMKAQLYLKTISTKIKILKLKIQCENDCHIQLYVLVIFM